MQASPALAYRASIAAACVVAAARLVPYLGDRVMHRDEALAVMVARRPLGELLETVQLVRGGAPLHFLLAKAVAEFGGGLVATRVISALGLVLAVVAVGLLGRALAGAAVGAAAAWIAALSPVALYYGDFARMYSLFLAFSALACGASCARSRPTSRTTGRARPHCSCSRPTRTRTASSWVSSPRSRCSRSSCRCASGRPGAGRSSPRPA